MAVLIYAQYGQEFWKVIDDCFLDDYSILTIFCKVFIYSTNIHWTSIRCQATSLGQGYIFIGKTQNSCPLHKVRIKSQIWLCKAHLLVSIS